MKAVITFWVREKPKDIISDGIKNLVTYLSGEITCNYDYIEKLIYDFKAKDLNLKHVTF